LSFFLLFPLGFPTPRVTPQTPVSKCQRIHPPIFFFIPAGLFFSPSSLLFSSFRKICNFPEQPDWCRLLSNGSFPRTFPGRCIQPQSLFSPSSGVVFSDLGVFFPDRRFSLLEPLPTPFLSVSSGFSAQSPLPGPPPPTSGNESCKLSPAKLFTLHRWFLKRFYSLCLTVFSCCAVFSNPLSPFPSRIALDPLQDGCRSWELLRAFFFFGFPNLFFFVLSANTRSTKNFLFRLPICLSFFSRFLSGNLFPKFVTNHSASVSLARLASFPLGSPHISHPPKFSVISDRYRLFSFPPNHPFLVVLVIFSFKMVHPATDESFPALFEFPTFFLRFLKSEVKRTLVCEICR